MLIQIMSVKNFKNFASFVNCISELNNIQLDNNKDVDIVTPMYNVIEYIVIINQKRLEVCG